MVGNMAQIYSPYMYNAELYAPRYVPAMICNTIFVLAAIAAATLLRFCLKRENTKLEAVEVAQATAEPNPDPKNGEEIIQSALGGLLRLNPGFRYTL
jgi:hypothetical protein